MYYNRLVEKEIELKLKTSGAVIVAGPKFCGKTTTCMLYQKSFVKLNTKQSITMARMNPRGVLNGEEPRLIVEWQKAPDIWNQVKDDLDFDYKFGKYILTGSSTPADKTEVHHSGAGRIAPVKMRPMSLWESKESKGIISLMDLFGKKGRLPLGYEHRNNARRYCIPYMPWWLAYIRTGAQGYCCRSNQKLLQGFVRI